MRVAKAGNRPFGYDPHSYASHHRNDLRVAEAGNLPFGYDPHSYVSHHRKQLIGGKLTNFRQLLYSHDL